jgi:sulfite reductase alpha subunit-like flavoprotein
MRLPSPEVPIMMIGTGTGVAPFMSFLEQRAKDSSELSKGGGDVLNTLYLGVREEYDFIFENNFREYTESNMLQLNVAFSRASTTSVENIYKKMRAIGKLRNTELMARSYVSHFVQKDADNVRKFFYSSTNSTMYMCGSVKMSADVTVVLQNILGKRLAQDLKRQGRIVLDVWG